MRDLGRRLIVHAPAYAPALVVAAAALVARLVPVLRGGGLTGVLAYDDGVYYSAADALLSGRLPYRDYVLLHPPGSTLLLAPFAALGRLAGDPVGLATRVAFMLVGALAAVLVWRVARRVSPRAGLVAGLFYAVWQPASYAERTTLLEPLVNLGVLAALTLLTPSAGRRRVVAAGAMLGLAVAVKAWAVVPFAVLAVWLLRRSGRRGALAYTGAGAAAAAVVCLPFFLAAGPAMLRMVMLDQLGRPDNGVGTLSRLASIEALQLSPAPMTGGLADAAAVVAAAVAVAVVALAWRRPVTRVWAALLAAAVALLLTGPSYFAHYATFAAPSLALLAAHVVTTPEGRPVPAQAVREALAGSRCVAADSAAALVVAGVLTRDLRDGCRVVVDVTGLTYDQDPGDLGSGPTPKARRRDREWQRAVDRYLAGADAVVLDQWRADGLDPAELGRLEHRDLELGRPSYRVLVPAS